MIRIYTVTGMTCMGCVAHVKKSIEALEGVQGTLVSLSNGRVCIESKNQISLAAIQMALGIKYYISEAQQGISTPQKVSKLKETPATASPWKQLTPLYLIFGYIVGGVLLAYYPSFITAPFGTVLDKAMLDFMALFYLVFSFFKFLDLKGFPASFARYDPLAKKWHFYGKIYPFIELTLGVLLLLDVFVPQVLAATLIILGITTVGVLQSLLNQRKIQCACLGTALKLPMTHATFIENAIMIFMALWMLFKGFSA